MNPDATHIEHERRSNPHTLSPRADGIDVLLAASDDDRATRVRRLIAAAGRPFRVTMVPRATEVPKRLEEGAFDVAIVDLDSGDNALRVVVRLQHATPDLPLILLCRDPGSAFVRRAVALGAEDVLGYHELHARRLDRAIACAIERRRRYTAMRELSLTDPLTGLHNRRGFALLAEAHRRVLRRTHGHSLLLFADVDGLKSINDHHGHLAGDRAIVAAAGTLVTALRDSDIVARYGGDEFVALAHDAGTDAAFVMRERIATGLERRNASVAFEFPLSISVGIATFGAYGGLEQALARADRDLHREKARSVAAR